MKITLVGVSAFLAISCAIFAQPTLSNTYSFTPIESLKTDNTETSTTFLYRIDGNANSTAIQANSPFSLKVQISPNTDDIDQNVDLYSVVLLENAWWILNLEGDYVEMSGDLSGLMPFAKAVGLTKSFSTQIFSGQFSRPGNYSFFTAYAPADSGTLTYTSEPINISVLAGEVIDTNAETLKFFSENIENPIIQQKCIACHVSGGLARNSTLQFIRTNDLSAENNLETIKNYLATNTNGRWQMLDKASGGSDHPGGVQLLSESEEYKTFSNLLEEIIENTKFSEVKSFSFQKNVVEKINFIEQINNEPLQQTLRRASRILGNRLPSTEEKILVSDNKQKGFDLALNSIMQGNGFHKFILAGVEDRLFLNNNQAISDSAAIGDVNYPGFVKMNYDFISKTQDYDRLAREFWDRLLPAWSYTSGELVAYVIENDLPYSEILTADYMMMNRLTNQGYGGTATFSDDEDDSIFKPSKIQGYYLDDQIDNGKGVQVNIDNYGTWSHIQTKGPATTFPHSGLLTDMTFLARYPTTATNRNRARARWTFFHFLDIDIEGATQRPTDEAALQDTDNPTMNNPSCTVCHAILDPVAAAFQNWNERNQYKPRGMALDQYYKFPADGSLGMFQEGDTWYRDMREPGLFESSISDDDYALQELGQLIVREPAFYRASVKFWWLSIFGEPPLEIPLHDGDFNFDSKLKAYEAQQEFIQSLADILYQSNNMKDVFKRMVRSVWFRGDSVNDTSQNPFVRETAIAARQLLNASQIEMKIEELTGLVHNRLRRRDIYNGLPTQFADHLRGTAYQERVSLGGHNSDTVLNRREVVSPLMQNVYLMITQEISCPAVLYDFVLPKSKRRLFNLVEADDTPQNSPTLIREQIKQLTEKFLGSSVQNFESEVDTIYQLFQTSVKDSPKYRQRAVDRCRLGVDYYGPNLIGIDPEQVRQTSSSNNLDISKLRSAANFGSDENHVKSSWSIVVFYLLSHPDFIYE